MKLCGKCKKEVIDSNKRICKSCARQTFLKELENPICYKCKIRPHGKNVMLCNECRREYMRQKRIKDAGGWYRRLTPEQKEKRRIRAIIYISKKLGKIKQMPCEICGNTNTEAHHHLGYDRKYTFDVRWLCKKHHLESEKLNKFKLTSA